MKIEKTFLSGQVARRIFALFVLSAFAPMIVMAALTFGQVRSIITEQARSRLVAASQDFAMAVDQRLLLMDGNLFRLALTIRGGTLPGSRVLQTLKQAYSSLSIIGPGSRVTPLIGRALSRPEIDAAALARLAKDEPVLMVKTDPGSLPHILLLRTIDPGEPGNSALIAELNPASIWGDNDDFPYMTGLCMFADSGAMLFCSQPALAATSALLARSIADNPANARVSIGGEASLTGQWQLFLKPRFHEPYWTAIAAQPVAFALLPAARFSQIFIGVVVLALLLVALLSVSQIRRTMGPLARLIDGTRRVTDGDFGYRVDVPGNDEFGKLAASFNDMAGRLGNQLGTLKVLSDIDRVILSKLDLEPVLNIVLARIRKLTSGGFCGIAVLDAPGDGAARLYFIQPGLDSAMGSGRITIDSESLQEFARLEQGCWRDSTAALRQSLRQSAHRIEGPLFVLPVFTEETLRALICLEFADSDEPPSHVLTHLRDLGDRIGVAMSAVARDEKLVYQARHDDLTGLPNRLLFKEQLAGELSFAQREGRSLALLFIDLDRFKGINDAFGHSAGDQLLQEAARRLRKCNRGSDTVARLGGDEFAIILPALPGIRSATAAAEHILQAFMQPFMIAGQENYIGASIGIAIAPEDGNDGEDLLKKADTAMYRAKDLGRGRFVFFEEQMNIDAIGLLNLEREMRQALSRKEFVLYYQPKLDLHTGQIAGAEALLRWHHPARGLINPDEFISVAEDTGLIEEIGKNVIRDACAQHAAWRAAGIDAPRIAVNVSERQFRRGNLTRIFSEALQATSTPPGALEIEVTESLFMDKSSNAVAVLNELRQMGLNVTIDDFGTGYSSMSYLIQLPIDSIKIDKSFIAGMVRDENARAVAEVIVTLARTLHKSVVAEGVESAEQLDLLRKWRCDVIQGFHFSRPLTADRLVEFLQSRNTEGTCY